LYLARKKNNGPNLFIFVQPNFYFIFYKVVKTGPIEPGTGPASGPVRVQNRSAREPALNRKNRKKTGEPDGPSDFPGLHILKKKILRAKTTSFHILLLFYFFKGIGTV
jgi:hypothetical protein